MGKSKRKSASVSTSTSTSSFSSSFSSAVPGGFTDVKSSSGVRSSPRLNNRSSPSTSSSSSLPPTQPHLIRRKSVTFSDPPEETIIPYATTATATATATPRRDRQVFVTVGTTRFDDLVALITTPTILNLLCAAKFNRLVIQYGKSVLANHLLDLHHHSSLAISAYNFKPSLAADMNASDLIISHAGAGSILESLELGKRTIVVINETLMDNHQAELASELEKRNMLFMTTTSRFEETVRMATGVLEGVGGGGGGGGTKARNSKGQKHVAIPALDPLPPCDSSLFISEIRKLVGFV